MNLQLARLTLYDIPVVVVLADQTLENFTPEGRERVLAAAREALGSKVVLVWPDSGRTACLSPPCHRRFFESLRYDQLLAQASERITLSPA